MKFLIPYYPSISDPKFRDDIHKKYEYQKIAAIIAREGDSKPLYRDAMLRMIGPDTPYDRLLIIHSVGTGKTACAIGIVEQYKNIYKQAVILNKSDVPTHNFKSLLDSHFRENNVPITSIEQEKSFYKFDTYTKFAKKVATTSPELLKEMYERTVFIMDEIHNVVTRTHGEDDKSYTLLLSLFDMLETSVVVGMTATPMRDSYKEIVPLINMFIKNPDNRLSERVESFESIKTDLKMFANTTVSWYSQKFDFEIVEMGNSSIDLFLDTIELQAGSYQVEAYKEECKKIRFRSKSGTREGHNFMDKKLIYISLATFPQFGVDVADKLVIQSEIEIPKSGKDASISCHNYLFNREYGDILREFSMNPKEMSCKFAYTMSHIENDNRFMQSNTEPWSCCEEANMFKGLIYIFCEDIASTGIKTIMAMFQHFGYKYYSGGKLNTLDINYRRFTVYVGDPLICPNGPERLNTFRHPDNEDGRYCRIIIASNVMKESVSLKAIRKVFVWTSHWNYSSIIQAEGRALRRDSFIRTKVDKSVEIHRLATVIDKDAIEALKSTETGKEFKRNMREASIDIYKYYKSTYKMMDIKRVQDVLDEQSFDHHIINESEELDKIYVEDISTFVQTGGTEFEGIKNKIMSQLSNNRTFHISKMKDILREVIMLLNDIANPEIVGENAWIELAIQYLDRLKDRPIRIDNRNKYIKIKNDIIFAVEDPLYNELPLTSPRIHNRYRHEKLSEYVDIRSPLRPDFNWGMSKYEFVTNIKQYVDHRIDLIEQCVRIYHGKVTVDYDMSCIKNFMLYLGHHLYEIAGTYYHVIEKSHVTNARYSNNSSSLTDTTVVRKYDPESDDWLCIDTFEFNDISIRVKYIKIFKVLKITIGYGLYGSYSISDGELRIHNYNRNMKDRGNWNRYIDVCDTWIKYLYGGGTIDEDIKSRMVHDNIMMRESAIAAKKKINKYGIEVNMGDLRTDKRGLNVNSHSMEALIIIILKFYIYCASEEDCKEFFMLDKNINSVLYNREDVNDDVAKMLEDNPGRRVQIYMKYNDLKLVKSAEALKKAVRELITRSELYFIN